jgi:PAS domain S-box-containing protein
VSAGAEPDGRSAPAPTGATGPGGRPAAGPLRRLGLDPEHPHDPQLDDLLDLLRAVTGAAAAAVTVADGSRSWPLAVASAPDLAPVAAPGGPGDVTATALRDAGSVVWIADAAAEERFRDHAWVRDGGPVVTLAATSFRAPDRRPVGAITVGWSGPRPRSDDDVALLGRAASQIERYLDLRAEVLEYRRFLDRSPAAVAVLDLHGAIERCNPAFVELVGADAADALTGRHLLDLVDELDHDRARDELARVLFGRDERVRTELLLRGAGDDRFPASLSVGQLGGVRRRLQVVARDLSERIRGETERARLSEQLARAHRLETVGQLAGGLAHDLNNLLTVLVTNLGMADEQLAALAAGDDDLTQGLAAVAEDLGHVRAASDRVDELTRQLLQFAARRDGSPSRVGVADVLAGLRELLVRGVGSEVELITDAAADVPDVLVDPAQYEQAITNLVLNARDAMPGGGRITVTARREAGPTGTDAVVEVADEGSGMSDDVLARAFEPLFSTKSPDRGTGLGLASVLAFAESVDGAVHIDTAVGVGTRVALRVPAAAEHDAAAPDDSAPLALVVDPAELTRQVVAAMLTSAGYRTHVVATAEEARQVLADEQVAVVLCELALPDGAGTDVAAAAAGVDPTPAVVLLATTPEVRDHAASRTALVKPFSSDRLLHAVRAARVAVGQVPGRHP